MALRGKDRRNQDTIRADLSGPGDGAPVMGGGRQDPIGLGAAPQGGTAELPLREVDALGADQEGQAPVCGDQHGNAAGAGGTQQGVGQVRAVCLVIMAQNEAAFAGELVDKGERVGQARGIRQDPAPRQHGLPRAAPTAKGGQD